MEHADEPANIRGWVLGLRHVALDVQEVFADGAGLSFGIAVAGGPLKELRVALGARERFGGGFRRGGGIGVGAHRGCW